MNTKCLVYTDSLGPIRVWLDGLDADTYEWTNGRKRAWRMDESKANRIVEILAKNNVKAHIEYVSR